MNKLVIKGARENNLKKIDIELPKNIILILDPSAAQKPKNNKNPNPILYIPPQILLM